MLINEAEYRSNSMRMRDRVLYGRGFLRLAGKTQIYGINFEDHARNRLTHSLEVAQIARSLARGLNIYGKKYSLHLPVIDEYLVEAAALAHDWGHTPFGHAGERQLHEILNYRNEEINNILFGRHPLIRAEEEGGLHEKLDKNRGFKHNWQSVRMMKILCYEYQNGDMLPEEFKDAVLMLNGVLCHSGRTYKDESDQEMTMSYYKYSLDPASYEINDRYNSDFQQKGNLIAGIIENADEIAQRHHDIEDAIAFKYFSLHRAINTIFTAQAEAEDLPKDFKAEADSIKFDDKKRRVLDSGTFFMKKISHSVVGYLVKNCLGMLLFQTISDGENIDEVIKLKQEAEEAKRKYEIVMNHLKHEIKKMILTSQNVKRMDNRGGYIIRKIFESYAGNPEQMPNRTLNAVFREYLRQEFWSANDELRRNIEKHLSKGTGVYLFKHGYECRLAFEYCYELCTEKEKYLLLSEDYLSLSDENLKNDVNSVITVKRDFFRVCLMRVIADYISGMTDHYAETEYRKLYGIVHDIVQ